MLSKEREHAVQVVVEDKGIVNTHTHTHTHRLYAVNTVFGSSFMFPFSKAVRGNQA